MVGKTVACLASVVVVNYNGVAHLAGLFASLASQTVRDFELILVDNASQDGSPEMAAELARQHGVALRMLRNDRNAGFAAACNQGIRAAQAAWIVMLNNDTQPEPQWLSQLVATAERDPRVGMVASKMLFAHAPGRINTAGIAVDWAGIAWDWRGGAVDDPAEAAVVEVFGPCAGAGLYARRMLDQVGGFDEDFFAYLEDVDLAWRARLAGWRCLFEPQARVLHVHSGTFGEGSPFKRYLLGRNKVWLVVKNYPHPWFVRNLPILLGYDLMATTYGVLRRGDLAAARGRVASLSRLPQFWAKRRQIQRRWQDVDNWARVVAPLEAPWAVSRRYAHLEG